MSHNENDWRGVNLASARLGAEAVYASDDFFAPKERLLQDSDPVFIEGKYDEHGKWMDGWESRRKREEGSDYCIVKLGISGRIRQLNIDTRHFTGNYPPAAAVLACYCDGDPTQQEEWIELTGTRALTGNSEHRMDVSDDRIFNYVKLVIYPDGGVARLRVYGDPEIHWDSNSSANLIDLLAVERGGRAVACNDEHFGTMRNLILPGKGLNMGDGWETRRRREPGNDWVILALGHVGEVESVLVDTAYFKGNFPHSCSIQVANIAADVPESSLPAQSLYWQELLPKQLLTADSEHVFKEELCKVGAITHIKLNIYPDGGISRIRLFGRPVRNKEGR